MSVFSLQVEYAARLVAAEDTKLGIQYSATAGLQSKDLKVPLKSQFVSMIRGARSLFLRVTFPAGILETALARRIREPNAPFIPLYLTG